MSINEVKMLTGSRETEIASKTVSLHMPHVL